MINRITELISQSQVDGEIYLLEQLSEISGFFVSDKKLLYVVENNDSKINQNVKTDFLEMSTNVFINSIKDNQRFKSGRYNILIFSNTTDNNNFEAFVNLCIAHTKYMQCERFSDFFFSLINIFQIKNEQGYKNIIGLYGELAVMDYVLNEYNFDLSPYWHLEGANSKYDFSLPSFNMEVKSTSSKDSLITIKHSQLFNEDENILGKVILEKNNHGLLLKQFLKKFYGEKKAFKNLNFVLNVEKELKRISQAEIDTYKFIVKEISFYESRTINPLKEMPDNITDLCYKIDLSSCKNISLGERIKQ